MQLRRFGGGAGVHDIGLLESATVQKYFYRWHDEGLLRAISNELVNGSRLAFVLSTNLAMVKG